MNTLSSSELFQFLLAITLMLGLGKGFGEVFRKFKQASVVGEIIAGILLGPTIFGLISPETFNWIFPEAGPVAYSLDALTSLAIIFLLLAVGLEVDLAVLVEHGKSAVLTTVLSMVIPFIIGFTTAYLLPMLFSVKDDPHNYLALFIGLALSISALPIIARTLLDLDLFKTRFGMMVIAAAMFNDLIGWIGFSIFLSFVETESHGLPLSYSVSLTLAFTFIMIIFVRKLVHKILPLIQQKLSWPGAILSFIMVSALLGSLITEKLGVHAILGAFIVGVTIGDSAHLSERTREIIQQFITNIFAPLFFVYIGLRINFIQSFDLLTVFTVVSLGFVSKILGAGLGAYLGGSSKQESLAVGFAMNSRGVLEIVLSLFALRYEIITDTIFVGIVILVILSSVLSSPLIKIAFRKRDVSFKQLLNKNNIIITQLKSKENVIAELTRFISQAYNLDHENIYRKVIEREELISTGIGNYVAVPHARLNILKPAIAIAINKNGVDFNSPDDLPAKIIVMLLSPIDNNEMQLKLLAQIASAFNDKSTVEDILTEDSIDGIYNKIVNLKN